MKRSTRLLYMPSFAATVLALALGTAWAQGSGSYGTSTSTGARGTMQQGHKLERADRRFMEETAASGLFELQAAQLATTKAMDPAVKEYAGMMADYHGVANRELTQLAGSLGLELPLAPPRGMRRELEQLGKKTGADFDQEFVRKVGVREHEKDIRRFQEASKDVKEPQLRAWIDKNLPSLQQQLAQAQKLPQAQSGSARWEGGGSSTSGAGGSPGIGGRSGN
jgi:putative membrane protein